MAYLYVQVSGTIYLGEYSANTTIDVSALGATSANQFLVTTEQGSLSFTVTGHSHYTDNNMSWGSGYNKATLSLNNSILSLTVPYLTGSFSPWYNTSGRLTCKVYYVGDIESAS